MAIRKVARLGHPILRQRAAEVDDGVIGSAELKRIIEDMVETVREYDGVGLAAPQIHVPLRIVVIESVGNIRYPGAPSIPLIVLVNPTIESEEGPLTEDWEGCLSLPDFRGRVPRLVQAKVGALDAEGEKVAFTACGFHARIVQHEIDHLNGGLFIDRMLTLESLSYCAEWERYGRWADKSVTAAQCSPAGTRPHR